MGLGVKLESFWVADTINEILSYISTTNMPNSFHFTMPALYLKQWFVPSWSSQ